MKSKFNLLIEHIETDLFIEYIMDNYDSLILEEKKLSDAESKELIRKYKEENNYKAREELILLNMPLVNSIAQRKAFNKSDIQDYASEGVISMMQAIDRFDWRAPAQFSSYLYKYIEGAIMKAFYSKQKSLPSTSLDTPVGDDDSMTLKDIVQDSNSFIHSLQGKDDIQRMLQVIKSLPDVDRKIIEMYFGVNGNTKSNLEEIGKKVGYTKMRISQKLKEILSKLKDKLK